MDRVEFHRKSSKVLYIDVLLSTASAKKAHKTITHLDKQLKQEKTENRARFNKIKELEHTTIQLSSNSTECASVAKLVQDEDQ